MTREYASSDLELVSCLMCKKKFHVVCPEAKGDGKWATKSLMTNYKATSTKKNFAFLCNCCLTAFEKNQADYDGQRMRKMERNLDVINKELLEIKKLVSSNITLQIPPNGDDKTDPPINPQLVVKAKEVEPMTNIWYDTERLASVRAKPAESVLVVNKALDPGVDKTNTNLVENMVIESRIPVKRSFTNKNGNLVVVCDSEESRNELKEKVSASNNDIEMRTPKENRPVISIVGLSKNYEKEEVVDLLQKQNYFLSQFSTKK